MNTNRLSRSERATIITLLFEGMSMRAISRITGAFINTITKLLVDAGKACAEYHDETVRDVRAKQANVEKARKAPEGAGDTWTWTALDADNKLIISWHV